MKDELDLSAAKEVISNVRPGAMLRTLLTIASVIIILLGFQQIAGFINPILVAFLLAVGLTPVVGAFEKRGMSRTKALAALIAIMLGIALGLAFIIASSFSHLIANVPTYLANTQSSQQSANQVLDALGIDVDRLFPTSGTTLVNASMLQNTLSSMAGSLLILLGQAAMIFLLFIFLLTDLLNLPKRISGGLQVDPVIMTRIERVRVNVTTYFSIRHQVSLYTAIFNTITCWVFGVDLALLWGLITYLTGFLPSFGFILSAIGPIILAWLEFGIERAVAVAVVLLGVNTVIDQIVSPRLTARGMSLPVSVVLISMMFWGWLMGVVGAFLAAPLTMILKLTLDEFPEAKNLANLITMGSGDGGGAKKSGGFDPRRLVQRLGIRFGATEETPAPPTEEAGASSVPPPQPPGSIET